MHEKTRRTFVKTVSFLSALCVLLGALAFVNAKRAARYRQSVIRTANQSLSQLCTQLDAITTALQKQLYVGSEPMLTSLGREVSQAADGAKLTLSQLTDADNTAADIYRFLSQAGDFDRALSKKMQNGQPLSAADRKSLNDLYAYSKTLSAALRDIRSGLDDAEVDFEEAVNNLMQQTGAQRTTFHDAFQSAEQTMTDYPTLLYDGPFADARLNREALAVKGKDEISLQTAKSRAAKFLSCDEKDLQRESDEDSTLQLYCFSKSGRTVGITKHGGLLCYLTNPNHAGKSEIDEPAAVKVARKYLSDIGYKNMKENYYSTYDGVCTVNFAFVDRGVTCYADLIKVSVGLDSAAVVAVDARGYLMNHTDRDMPEIKVSLKRAVRNLPDDLKLLDYKTALIPLDDGTEALCHELHCRDGGNQEVLIYADTQSPREADIRILTYADDGVLAK